MQDPRFSKELLNLKKRLAAVFAAAVLCIVAGVLAYHSHYQKAIKKDAADLLSSILQSKTEQLVFWRNDRINDTSSLLDTPVLSVFLNRLAAAPADKELRAWMLSRLDRYLKHNRYRSALLAQPDGRIIVATAEADKKLLPETLALIKKAAASGRTELGDFYLAPSGKPRIDIAAKAAEGKGNKLYLVLEISPEDYLYPLIRQWPTATGSGEATLSRREGDSAVSLTSLRFSGDAPLKLRLPLSSETLPAARALRGETGIFQGRDYRGKKVLAAAGMVPGSGWALVVKMDWSEIMTKAGRISALILLLTIALVLAAGGWAYLLFRVQAEKYSRAADLAAAGLRESERIFDSFMEYSPIYVFFKDRDIRSLRLSRNYETMLGKPMTELLGKTMDDLFPSELARNMIADDKKILEEGKEVTVEEAFNGRNYRTIKFPVRLEGGKVCLAGYTIDITEQKLAADKLTAAAREWETTFNAIDDVVWTLNAENRVIRANAATGKFFSSDLSQIKGRHCWEIVHGTSGPVQDCPVIRARRTLRREIQEYRIKDKIFEVVADPITGADGQYAGSVHILRDITARKQAQFELEKTGSDLREAQKDLVKNLRLYTILAQINQAAAQTKELDRLYPRLCEIAVDAGGFRMAWISYPDSDTGRMLPICHAGTGGEDYLSAIKISFKDGPTSKGPTATAARTGKVAACGDIASDPVMEPWREAALKFGYRSSAAIPLYDGAKLVSVLSLYSAEKDFFSKTELDLLLEIKADISLAIEAISTEAKRSAAQTALERTANHLTQVMEAMPVILFTLRLVNDRFITQWVSGNPRAVTGHDQEEILSPGWMEKALHPQDRDRVLEERKQIFKTGTLAQDFRVSKKDGAGYVWVHSQLRASSEASGEITGSWIDITQMKESEIRLRELLDGCRDKDGGDKT